MLSGVAPNGKEARPPGDDAGESAPSLIDMFLRQAQNELDHIEEPTAADLAAIDELDDLAELADLDEPPLEDPPAQTPELNPALSLLAELEEPELVSLEGLDDVEPLTELADDIDGVEELLDDVEDLIEEYVDLDLDDAELEDEGYDLDDDDVSSYSDLYGDDDTIIPSFREGEFAEEDEPDTAYYDDMR